MDLTYNDYLQRIKMQELLLDAGYVLNKRDGLRWPVYVMLDSTGRRVSGDKFIVNPRTNTCCQPPALRSYNIISFIKCHPYLFKENSSDINPDRLVNLVCHRLLNVSEDIRKERRIDYSKATKPFDIDDYKITSIDGKDFDTMKPFYPYFKSRGINRWTQLAFHHDFCLAEKRSLDGYAVFKNLSFPLRVPGTDKICGLRNEGNHVWTVLRDIRARHRGLTVPEACGWPTFRESPWKMQKTSIGLNQHTMQWHSIRDMPKTAPSARASSYPPAEIRR